MSNKQTTAVQWLIDKLSHDEKIYYKKELEQAKAIERKQIEDAYQEGHESTYITCDSGCMGNYVIDEPKEKYFTLTFTTE